MAVDDTYETDFFAWTQAQAEALRAAGRAEGRSNAVEWERVAEELEDVGKSEYREAASYVALIIEHLYKRSWSVREPKLGWRAEIIRFRGARMSRRLTQSSFWSSGPEALLLSGLAKSNSASPRLIAVATARRP